MATRDAKGAAEEGVRSRDAGLHAYRWRIRLDARCGDRGGGRHPISTHLYPEVAAHVMRATETAHWLEWQDWADPVLQRPYEINDGLLHIPDVAGRRSRMERGRRCHAPDGLSLREHGADDFRER